MSEIRALRRFSWVRRDIYRFEEAVEASLALDDLQSLVLLVLGNLQSLAENFRRLHGRAAALILLQGTKLRELGLALVLGELRGRRLRRYIQVGKGAGVDRTAAAA